MKLNIDGINMEVTKIEIAHTCISLEELCLEEEKLTESIIKKGGMFIYRTRLDMQKDNSFHNVILYRDRNSI